MKKIINKKNVIKLLSILVLVIILESNFAYAELGNGLNTNILNQVTTENYNVNEPILNPVIKVAGTLLTLFQILGLGGVVYMGVKYMYAGAEDKGQIKKTLIWVVVGVMFLFGAPAIIRFIQKMSNTLL